MTKAEDIREGFQARDQAGRVVWTATENALRGRNGNVRIRCKWDTGESGNRFFKMGDEVAGGYGRW